MARLQWDLEQLGTLQFYPNYDREYVVCCQSFWGLHDERKSLAHAIQARHMVPFMLILDLVSLVSFLQTLLLWEDPYPVNYHCTLRPYYFRARSTKSFTTLPPLALVTPVLRFGTDSISLRS